MSKETAIRFLRELRTNEKAKELLQGRERPKNKTGLDCFTEQKSDGAHIYCGSFSNKANADARAQLLRNAGFDTAIEEA